MSVPPAVCLPLTCMDLHALESTRHDIPLYCVTFTIVQRRTTVAMKDRQCEANSPGRVSAETTKLARHLKPIISHGH